VWYPHETSEANKMCLNETSRVWDGEHLSYMFPIKNSLQQGDALLSLLFSFALEYAIRSIHVNQESLKLKWYTPASSYANDVNILGRSIQTIKKNRSFSGLL
jgi:hypothetical protein